MEDTARRGRDEAPEEAMTIPVVFDKSHLLTIGERLYSTSLDLIRELVSNAYDADATRVAIEITKDHVRVADNGSGMDEYALHRYFTIGSTDKRAASKSPRFGRQRIGEFGIGKFSALTLARQFTVETQHAETRFRARVVFDCDLWERDMVSWNLPYERLDLLAGQGSGTTIMLTKLKRPLESALVMRHVRERLPIGRPDFSVAVNGVPIQPTAIPGRRFPVDFETSYGWVRGEIILANLPPSSRTLAEAGITIRVKGVAVTRSLFGFEQSHAIGVGRLRGAIHADFIPITSSRDNVIIDSDEFQAVFVKIREYLKTILGEARILAAQKENMQASRILKEALERIGRALKRNPEAFSESSAEPPLGIDVEGAVDAGRTEEGFSISKARIIDADAPTPGAGSESSGAEGDTEKKKFRPKRHVGLANRAVIRKLEFRNLGVICRMERFGNEYPPSFVEQGVIYINIDHPLYRKQQENDSLLGVFVSSLISKELALKKHAHDSAEAFRLQHELLTEALRHVKKL